MCRFEQPNIKIYLKYKKTTWQIIQIVIWVLLVILPNIIHLQCHVGHDDHGCNSFPPGSPQPPHYPPSGWPARGAASLPSAKGKSLIQWVSPDIWNHGNYICVIFFPCAHVPVRELFVSTCWKPRTSRPRTLSSRGWLTGSRTRTPCCAWEPRSSPHTT